MVKLAQAMTIVAVFAVLAIGLFLFNNGSITGQVTSQKELVTLAYVPGTVNAIPIVALRKGYFADEGLQIEEVRTSFVGYVFQELANGNIDVLTGGEVPGVFMALKGGEFSILATHEVSIDDQVMVSRKSANIKSVKDLVGKKIGVPFYSVSHYGVFKMLENEGLNSSSVIFIDTKPETMGSALSRGDVDTIFFSQPIPTRIQQSLGAEVTSFTPESKFVMNLYTSKRFNEKLETQKKVLRAMLKAEKFINENNQEAIEIVAKETSIEVPTLTALWPKLNLHVAEFSEVNLMEEEANWAIQNKFVPVTNIPNFTQLNNPIALREVLAEQAKQ